MQVCVLVLTPEVQRAAGVTQTMRGGSQSSSQLQLPPIYRKKTFTSGESAEPNHKNWENQADREMGRGEARGEIGSS